MAPALDLIKTFDCNFDQPTFLEEAEETEGASADNVAAAELSSAGCACDEERKLKSLLRFCCKRAWLAEAAVFAAESIEADADDDLV